MPDNFSPHVGFMRTPEILSIGNADQRLGVLPELGASAAFWEVRRDGQWQPIWRPYAHSDGPKRIVANFPLLPWSNRLMQGGFSVGGKFYPVAPNRPDASYPMHGTGWMAEWQTERHTAEEIVLTTESRHACGHPWHYAARQCYAIDGAQMTMRLEVTHLGDEPLPYGLGFHPYILRPQGGEDARLRFGARGYWQAEKGLPVTHCDQLPPDWDFNQLRPLSHGKIDHNFTGCNGRMTMERLDIDLRLDWQTTAPEGLDLAIVFRPEHDEWFCYEPVTHITNAFHHPGMPGLRLLEKGQRISLEVRQSLSRLGSNPSQAV